MENSRVLILSQYWAEMAKCIEDVKRYSEEFNEDGCINADKVIKLAEAATYLAEILDAVQGITLSDTKYDNIVVEPDYPDEALQDPQNLEK